MTKLKILHIVPALFVGGAEKLIYNSICLLSAYEHHVITFDGDPTFIEDFKKVSTVYLKKAKAVYTFSNLMFLKKIERCIKPDIIHSHLIQVNWLSRLAFFKHYNLINSIHSLYSKDAFPFHFYTKHFEKLSYQWTNSNLVFVSESVKKDYEEHILLKNKSFVLSNFVEGSFFNLVPKKYIPKTTLKLVAVGNVKPVKNHALLLSVFKQLKNYPISVDIYGQGLLFEQLKKEVDENNLTIQFRGNDKPIHTVFEQYHAFIFPSFYEGFSVALLEAMAASMPLLLSDIPVFRTLVDNRAYYFDPSSSQSCSNAILKLYNEGFPESFLKNNKELVRQKFSSSVYSAELIKIYESISTPA